MSSTHTQIRMQASLVHVAVDQFTSPVAHTTTRVRTPGAPSRFVRNAPMSPSTPVSTVRLPFLELDEFAARGEARVTQSPSVRTPSTPQTPLARAIIHVGTPETPDAAWRVDDNEDVVRLLPFQQRVAQVEDDDENNVEDVDDALFQPVPRIVRVHDAYVARRLMY